MLHSTPPAAPPTRVSDTEIKLKSPIRLGIALFVGGILWLGPFLAVNSVLLPARLQVVDPTNKVALVALFAIVGSIVAIVANILFGAFSDLTRSRLGRRTPWMLVGSVGASASLLALSAANTVGLMIAAWCFFQLFLNAIVAPLLAIIADRTPSLRRGTYSTIYGLGTLIGALGGQIVAAPFVTDPVQGIVVFAIAVLIAGPFVALLAPEASNKDAARQALSRAMFAQNFAFPTKGARDFYFALFGKLMFMLGTYSISGYQLYILTDYIHLNLAQAGSTIGTMASIQLGASLVFGIISGPVSDRVGRRKPFVIGAAILVATASLIPFLAAEVWAMLTYSLLVGIGGGIFNSVDQALNIEVLPSADSAAKDLGVLNMANSGGQILGPSITSAVVGLFGGFGPLFPIATGIVLIGAALTKPIRAVK
jgi:MFS family permease